MADQKRQAQADSSLITQAEATLKAAEREARRRSRRPEPLIVDPATHPRETVCLRVAADFLGLDERSVRARIEDGRLPAIRDGKVYRIAVSALVCYQHALAS